MKVRNYSPEYKDYQTIRQWAKKGFLPIDSAVGVELWANQNCQDKYVYYSPDEVAAATAEQLSDFFQPERERKNELARRRRAMKRAEQEREKAEERQEEINEAIRPYLQRIAEQRKIIRSLTSVEAPGKTGSKKLIIDTETTGLDPVRDEILQISIIDSEGNTLYDGYFKPFATSWKEAQRIHGISPEMVEDAPRISDKLVEINSILSQAECIIGYNVDFDINFLRNNGVIIYNDIGVYDVMKVFAEIYGEYSEYFGNFKWQKLTTAAEYYNYDWSSTPSGAHNSLADCYATLHVYNKINEKS